MSDLDRDVETVRWACMYADAGASGKGQETQAQDAFERLAARIQSLEQYLDEAQQEIDEACGERDEAWEELSLLVGGAENRIAQLEAALREAAAWLESRPDYTEGDAATASRLRNALWEDE